MNLYLFKRRISMILSFPLSLFFNFYYLPFRQAIQIPIILYNPKFWRLKGKIIIDTPNIYFGMIRLGLFNTPIINGHGFIWMNEGGTVIFHGKACFGAGSVLKIAGSNALLEIGDDFNNASSGRIDCSYNINIKERVRLGWGTIIMDSSMHRLKDVNGRWAGKGYASIEIGENSWISSQCLVLPGTKFPSYSICAIGSILNKDYSQGEKGLYAGRPATFKKAGIWRDIYDDQIVYEKE